MFLEDTEFYYLLNYLIENFPSIEHLPLNYPKHENSRKKFLKDELFKKGKKFIKVIINQFRCISIKYLKRGNNVFVITDPSLSLKNYKSPLFQNYIFQKSNR